MPKIIFWNVQRAGSPKDVKSEAWDNLVENLIGLSAFKPEMIVLCEGLKGLQKSLRLAKIPGYDVVKPLKDLGGYKDDNTLRYVVFKRSADVGCKPYLVDTGDPRPTIAVKLTVGHATYNLLAIHAPSVTATHKPQSEALAFSLKTLADKHYDLPSVIFGDFNVDAKDDKKRDAFKHHVSTQSVNGFNLNFEPAYSKEPTRPASGKILDWALKDQKYSVDVSVVKLAEAPANMKRKWGNNNNNINNKDEEDDPTDPPYNPMVDSLIKSDHEAIAIDIN